MIEVDILRSILLNDKKLADEAIRKHGLLNVLRLVKKNKVKNNFLRLINTLNPELSTYSIEQNDEYIQKNKEAKKLSLLLDQNGINHIFF